MLLKAVGVIERIVVPCLSNSTNATTFLITSLGTITSSRPYIRPPNISHTEKSKQIECMQVQLSVDLKSYTSELFVNTFTTFRCSIIVPFGLPVVPDV